MTTKESDNLCKGADAKPGLENEDISRMSEEELLESKALMQLVLMGTDEGIWGWDMQSGLITLSKNWLHVFTHDPEKQVVNFEWWQELVHPDSFPVFEKALKDYQEGRTKYYELEYRIKDKNGEWIWLWEKGLISEHDEDGNPLKMIGTHRDITERKKAEEKLQEANHKIEREKLHNKILAQSKFASLGQLATGVAHEINQPLTFIQIMLESQLKDIEAKNVNLKELAGDSVESLRQVKRISKIIDHLRVFGRDDGTTFDYVDLGKVADNALILMGQKMKLQDIEFKQNIEDNLPTIWGSAIQLEQVLINLFSNSIDALQGKKEKNISLLLFSENSEVKLKVTDNAGGIHDDIQERIFEPFFTTKPPGAGTGIGLSIVYGIVKKHKGDISYIPTPGGSSSFLITLPQSK